MICVGCNRSCRRTCSRGSHGWCSYCADAAGTLVCSRCQQQTAAKRQQSKQAAQQSRAAIAAAAANAPVPVYVPSWTPPAPVPAPAPALHQVSVSSPASPRKALYAMDETELEGWCERTRIALDDMRRRNEAYVGRRAARGTVTSTDISLQRDNVVAADIESALTELVILWRMAHSGVSLGFSSPPTGMLIDYDDPGSKVCP